jgi:hypothetical protein
MIMRMLGGHTFVNNVGHDYYLRNMQLCVCVCVCVRARARNATPRYRQ